MGPASMPKATFIQLFSRAVASKKLLPTAYCWP